MPPNQSIAGHSARTATIRPTLSQEASGLRSSCSTLPLTLPRTGRGPRPSGSRIMSAQSAGIDPLRPQASGGGHYGRRRRQWPVDTTVTGRTMASSRRQAGTVLGGRRRGRRPRSAEDYRNDESDGVGGHGQPRTDNSTKCKRGCDGRVPKLRHMRAKDGNMIPEKLLHTRRTERQASYMPSLLCAPEAHSSLLGLAPTAANKHDSTQAPVSCCVLEIRLRWIYQRTLCIYCL